MKLGPFDGTTEEIKDFCENHGLDISAFIVAPEPPLSGYWICIPAIAFVVTCFAMAVFAVPPVAKTIELLFARICAAGAAIALQFRVDKIAATIGAGICALLVMLFSAGVITLPQVLEHVEKLDKPSKD